MRATTSSVMGQQVNQFTGDGYFGPCPGATPPPHTYVFEVYALDAATLPVTGTYPMPSAVRTAMMAHDLASGTLSGTSQASM
ncbi:MAG TPA: YbhB/YbcL family Raf kinase inhibitor-like protein [Polyangia bacterium]|nr:YbhB/YbcL family Raf kinase inhibitor-like protein [Polyangia bacterium]